MSGSFRRRPRGRGARVRPLPIPRRRCGRKTKRLARRRTFTSRRRKTSSLRNTPRRCLLVTRAAPSADGRPGGPEGAGRLSVQGVKPVRNLPGATQRNGGEWESPPGTVGRERTPQNHNLRLVHLVFPTTSKSRLGRLFGSQNVLNQGLTVSGNTMTGWRPVCNRLVSGW